MSMRACSMSLWAGALAAHLTLTSLRPRTCTCHGAPCQVGLLAAVFNPNPNPNPNPDQVGFLAAVFNNGIDCVQNVFSKKLLSSHYNYVNLQAAPPLSRHPSRPPSAPAAPLARRLPRACPAPAPRARGVRPSRHRAPPPHPTPHYPLTTPLHAALPPALPPVPPPERAPGVCCSSTPLRRRSWCSSP